MATHSSVLESQGRGAWWAAVYGVTQSQIRLKRLSSSSSHLYYFHAEYIVLREMSLLHPEVSKQKGCR